MDKNILSKVVIDVNQDNIKSIIILTILLLSQMYMIMLKMYYNEIVQYVKFYTKCNTNRQQIVNSAVSYFVKYDFDDHDEQGTNKVSTAAAAPTMSITNTAVSNKQRNSAQAAEPLQPLIPPKPCHDRDYQHKEKTYIGDNEANSDVSLKLLNDDGDDDKVNAGKEEKETLQHLHVQLSDVSVQKESNKDVTKEEELLTIIPLHSIYFWQLVTIIGCILSILLYLYVLSICTTDYLQAICVYLLIISMIILVNVLISAMITNKAIRNGYHKG